MILVEMHIELEFLNHPYNNIHLCNYLSDLLGQLQLLLHNIFLRYREHNRF
jgi:hypothetical protein